MKKKLFSMLMLTAAFAMPMFVNAEEVKQPSDFNDQKSVIVGNIDEPVYSVDIEWGNFSYDWKYDKDTNKFGFKANVGCEGYVMSDGMTELPYYKANNLLYSDNTCSTLQTADLVNGTTYYAKTSVGGFVRILDESVNAKIKANASFTPSQDYEWISGKFYKSLAFSPVSGKIQYFNQISDGYLSENTDPIPEFEEPLEIQTILSGFNQPTSEFRRAFTAWLSLDINDQVTQSNTITAADVIGTVTIEISQDTD